MPVKGGHISEETRIKITLARAKQIAPMLGKHHSVETKAKMSATQRGKSISIETRSKISNSLQGKKLSSEQHENFLKVVQSPEHRAKLSVAHKGKPLSESHYNNFLKAVQSPDHRAKLSNALTGRKLSPEHRAKVIAAIRLPKRRGEQSAIMKERVGKNANNWRGGISFEPYCPKFNDDLKQRIREFFENQCVMCGNPNTVGRNLCCHHVTYNKEMCCDGKPVRFAALCHSCHAKTNGGDRQRWEDMLHRSIEEIWGGKSYFTKEEFLEMNHVDH